MYISHYAQYPIFEPAEGGYYYSGNQLVESKEDSENQCNNIFERIWEECREENKNTSDKWILLRDKKKIYRKGEKIGDGESFVIEESQGSQESGYQEYC